MHDEDVVKELMYASAVNQDIWYTISEICGCSDEFVSNIDSIRPIFDKLKDVPYANMNELFHLISEDI